MSVTRSAVLVAAGLAALALPLRAQAQLTEKFEIRPAVGAYIPIGDQRDLLKDAILVGAQASYAIIPQLAITGTLGWSPTTDRITAGNQTVDLFQYDVGAEARAPSWVGGEDRKSVV